MDSALHMVQLPRFLFTSHSKQIPLTHLPHIVMRTSSPANGTPHGFLSCSNNESDSTERKRATLYPTEKTPVRLADNFFHIAQFVECRLTTQ